MAQPGQKTVRQLLEGSANSSRWPSNPTPRHPAKRNGNYPHKNLYVDVASSTARRQKQPGYPPTDERMNKMRYNHTTGRYPAVKY